MRRAFTLIELMIVIAIIAVIAAIAIPGLLAAQRSSNERNASSCLRMIVTVEADFRSNDRDGDRTQNYWTGNVYGFYALCPSTNGATVGAVSADNMIKQIEPSIASADGNVGTTLLGVAPVTASVGVLSPKASYVYRAFTTYAVGTGQANYAVTGNIAGYGPMFNYAKFAFMCFPTSYAVGRQIFIVDETSTVFRGDPGSGYTASYVGGATTSTSAFTASVGGTPIDESVGWPTSPGASGWSKLD